MCLRSCLVPMSSRPQFQYHIRRFSSLCLLACLSSARSVLVILLDLHVLLGSRLGLKAQVVRWGSRLKPCVEGRVRERPCALPPLPSVRLRCALQLIAPSCCCHCRWLGYLGTTTSTSSTCSTLLFPPKGSHREEIGEPHRKPGLFWPRLSNENPFHRNNLKQPMNHYFGINHSFQSIHNLLYIFL